MKNKTILIILLILALLGLATSIYLTSLHYKNVDSICDFNQKFSCTDVSRSAYSLIFNIPVAIYGIVAYLFFALVPLLFLTKFSFKKISKYLCYVLVARLYFYVSLFGFFFSLYLTYIELNTIHVICPLCLLSQIIVVLILFFSYLFYDHLRSKVGNFCMNGEHKD
jgi:uncharacterized membrane protein